MSNRTASPERTLWLTLASALVPGAFAQTTPTPVHLQGDAQRQMAPASQQVYNPVRANDLQPDLAGFVAQEHAQRLTPVVHFPELVEGAATPDAPGGAIPFGPAPEPTKVYFDHQNGEFWAMGSNYKAMANDQGFSFVPFLGSDAPQNYPVHFRLQEVRVGGDALELAPKAEVTQSGDRFILDRGPVDVWYDMQLNGVEQSFAFEAVGGTEDLDLLIAVDTELAWQETGNGLSWGNELGGVTYQKALVLDSAGHELEIPIQRDADRIHLTVPGTWLAKATGPIVVDPLLNAYSIYSGNDKTQVGPDVAYDYTTDSYLYVVQSNYSATDHDIRMEQYDSVGGMIATGWIDFTGQNWNDPAVANDNLTNTFLMVALFESTDGNAVWCRSINATNLALSPTVQVGEAVSGSYYNLTPDVGGKSQGTSLFKAVWSRYFITSGVAGIRSATIVPTNPHSTTVAPTVNGTEFMTGDSGRSFYSPAISKSSGQAGNAEWRVAFGSRVTASGQDEINSARYADDNTLLHAYSPLYLISSLWSLDKVDVSDGLSAVPGPVNGDATYCIVGSFTGTYGPQIWWYGMDRDTYFDVQSLTTREHQAITGYSKYDACIATSEDNFICSYLEWFPAEGQYREVQTRFDLVSTGKFGVSERRLRLSTTPFRTGYPVCSASRFSGGNYGSRYVASAIDSWDGSLWRTRGNQTYQSFVDIAGYQYCTGNPNSTGDYGHMIVFGDASVLGVKTLSATHMPLNQFGYFLSGEGGFGTITVSQGVQCLIGGPLGRYNQPLEVFFTGTTGNATLNIGPASYRGPGGNVAVFAGDVWNFQAWHRENGGFSNFTDAVSITLE